MKKNDLLYLTLMVLGFLATGVILIIFAPIVYWLGITTIFVAVVITLWVLSIVLIKTKLEE